MLYKAEDLDKLKFCSFQLVGPPKTGKTEALATLHKLKTRPWVKGKKFVIYDFDNGCQPLIRVAEREGWADELVIWRPARSTKIGPGADREGSTTVFSDFMNHFNAFYDMIKPDTNDWYDDALVDAPYAMAVDSATSFADHVMAFTLGTRHKSDGKSLGGANVDGRAEFGAQMGKIVEVVRSFSALPCFTVFNFHSQLQMGRVRLPSAPKGGKVVDPVTTGVIADLPVVTGQLAFTIGAEFGAILYSLVEINGTNSRKYLWKTSPDG